MINSESSSEFLPASPELEKGSSIVEQSANLRFVLHGTSSKTDLDKIKDTGLNFTIGRATVSGNLAHALRWATEHERREHFSKSGTNITPHETGAIILLSVPEEYQTGLGTYTSAKIDADKKIIDGDVLKFIGGLKQLGIYPRGDLKATRTKLEQEKESLGRIKALGNQAEIDKQNLLANPVGKIDRENILAIINPTPGLSDFLASIGNQLLGQTDLTFLTQTLASLCEGKISTEVCKELIYSTIESIIVSKVRNLVIQTKIFQGYRIFNKDNDITADQTTMDKAKIIQAIGKLDIMVSNVQTEPKLAWLSEYVNLNTSSINEDLKNILS